MAELADAPALEAGRQVLWEFKPPFPHHKLEIAPGCFLKNLQTILHTRQDKPERKPQEAI